ncbi:penicillin-binding protein activator [Hephaestia sp. GCM10023244]|uniref:penicillin-binding protein activator n=1 Tax=unclassified Hephaestia TaxID=2631281 RepID=UPI002076F455|nr:penicillin-binding protein activator [Hephaestia sp. MAHUQ-44]MCM8729618.1 penicillin-binding protein activator [Hephaestia sp. MAHUQ-44]
MTEAMVKPQRGRSLLKTLAIAATAFLAGCQTLVPKGPPPVETTAPPPVTRPSVEQGIPTDTERNRVALLVPLTGTNAGVGQSIANATMMALLDSKSERVRITNYDTSKGAAVAVRQALADGNKLIIGPLLSDDVKAVSPIARNAGVPVITFSNDISVAGNGTYVLGYSPAQSIDRVVDYAKQRGVTQYAGLIPLGLYGQRASTAFLRAVEDAGGEVVSLETYGRSRGALSGAIARLADKGPYGAVLIADTGETAATAAPLMRKAGGSERILGTELWNTDTTIAAQSALDGAWFATVPNGLYRQYATKYRARFGKAPYRLSTLGYDVVLLTVRLARDWKPGSAFPEPRLRDTGGFTGIDGAFRFGRDGVAQRALEVQEIRSGQAVTVSAAPAGFEK